MVPRHLNTTEVAPNSQPSKTLNTTATTPHTNSTFINDSEDAISQALHIADQFHSVETRRATALIAGTAGDMLHPVDEHHQHSDNAWPPRTKSALPIASWSIPYSYTHPAVCPSKSRNCATKYSTRYPPKNLSTQRPTGWYPKY